jgi:hypothetical protein
MGSLMIEENVVAEAGTVHYLTLDEIRAAIEELGFTPRQRNVFYELMNGDHERRAIEANRNRAAEKSAHGGNGAADRGDAPHARRKDRPATPPLQLSTVSGDGTA